MIVRNEAAVIKRCLDSVKGLIDYWTIVDTGSTDDTQEIIRQTMKGVPGKLYQKPWVDFAHNRTEAIKLAHSTAEYLLLMDADYELVQLEKLPKLTADIYMMSFEGAQDWRVPGLVKASKDWYYVGKAHEYLTCDLPHRRAITDTLIYRNHGDGAGLNSRSRRNLELLLQDEMNDRTIFYLAQTYRELGETKLAIEYYDRHLAMGGWAEELFYSAWMKALLLQDPALLLDAWQMRPNRAEPLFSLAQFYRLQGKHYLAYLFATQGLQTPYPKADFLFIQRNIYEYELKFEWAIAAYNVGNFQGAYEMNQQLLKMQQLPENFRRQVLTNQAWCKQALEASQ